jgi:nitrogen fixation-related uncharacterized protein
MDLPVHVAAGALVGNTILYIADNKLKRQPLSQKQHIEVCLACFFWGVLSHLFLDAIPHYDWLFYVKIFSPLPFWWLIPQFLTTIPVLMITFYVTRDHWGIALVSVLGGVYPDIEKLMYLDFHLPQYLVVFRKHSCYLSQWTPLELRYKSFLIVFEVGLFFVLLGGLYWAARCRGQTRYTGMSKQLIFQIFTRKGNAYLNQS